MIILKKVISALFSVLIFLSAVLCLSGFNFEKCDNRLVSEYEASEIQRLLTERTEAMQRIAFGSKDKSEGMSLLMLVEDYPLLSEDLIQLESFEDSDIDTVVNMNVLTVSKLSSQKYTDTFSVKIKWYMNGMSGAYNCEQTYMIRVNKVGKTMKLTSMVPE